MCILESSCWRVLGSGCWRVVGLFFFFWKKGLSKALWFFIGFVIICLATNHQCLAIARKILRSR